MTQRHYLELVALYINEGISLPSFILTFFEWWKLKTFVEYESLYNTLESYLQEQLTETLVRQEIEKIYEQQSRSNNSSTQFQSL